VRGEFGAGGGEIVKVRAAGWTAEARRFAVTGRLARAAGAVKMVSNQPSRIGAPVGAVDWARIGVQASRTATKRSVDLMASGYHCFGLPSAKLSGGPSRDGENNIAGSFIRRIF